MCQPPMTGFDMLGGREIGDGVCHFEDPIRWHA
jgi:hypothetical protein